MIGNNGILFARRTRPDELTIIMKQIEKTMTIVEKMNKEPNLNAIDEANKVNEECDNIQTIVNTPYELPGKDITVDYILSYKEPIPINNSRHIRKLLETTNDDTFLISDSDSVFGLGRIKTSSIGIKSLIFLMICILSNFSRTCLYLLFPIFLKFPK